MRLDWDHLDVQLVSCGYSQWPSGVSHSMTWQHRVIPDNDLWIFDTGKCVMNMVGGKTQLKENSIIWMRPGHVYDVEQDFDNPIGHVYIHFELIRPDGSRYYPPVEEMPETFDCFNHVYWHAMGRNIVRVLNLAGFPCSIAAECTQPDIVRTASALLKSLLMGIDLCDTFSHDSRTSGGSLIAIQAAEYLADSVQSFPSVTDVAKHFGLSRNRFTRIFTDFWHMPPQDYLIEQRILHAKRMLTDTDLTLGEIAANIGYSDHYFFSRQFKERCGIAPGAYRKQAKQKPADGLPG